MGGEGDWGHGERGGFLGVVCGTEVLPLSSRLPLSPPHFVPPSEHDAMLRGDLGGQPPNLA